MSDKPEFKPPPFFYPVECDFLNPLASFSQSMKYGNHYYVRFEVTPELWKLFEEPDPGLHLRGPLYRVRDDASDETPADKEKAAEKPKREKKPKLGTDDNGKYWQAMHHLDWWYAPGLCEVLGCEKTEDSAAQALKVAFDVSSRREISADDFESWCERQRVESAITISKQARAKVSNEA